MYSMRKGENRWFGENVCLYVSVRECVCVGDRCSINRLTTILLFQICFVIKIFESINAKRTERIHINIYIITNM